MSAGKQADSALEAEIASHLARAGITPPPGRMADIAREYGILKQQLAAVRAALVGGAEPAVVFASLTRAEHYTRGGVV